MIRNEKILLIIIIGMIVSSILVTIIPKLVNLNTYSYTRPDYDYVAVICYSEMLGLDAGTQYSYYIYPSLNSKGVSYFYIKSKSDITIAGPGQEIDIDSGNLEKKSDLSKIAKDIQKDFGKYAESYVSYYYIINGTLEEYKNMNELGNKLF